MMSTRWRLISRRRRGILAVVVGAAALAALPAFPGSAALPAFPGSAALATAPSDATVRRAAARDQGSPGHRTARRPHAPKDQPAPPFVTMGDGTVVERIASDRPLRVAHLVRQQPCFRFAGSAGIVTTACLRTSTRARVTQTGRAWFTVPVELTRSDRRALDLTLRRADLMLPAGRSVVTAWCRSHCGRSTRAARVRPLRIERCTATRPWLVHSAPRPIGKAVALTFDDGPGAVTRKVLRVLADERVPATFFQVGVMIVQQPQLLPRILAAGHVIGNHSWSHPRLTGESRQQLTDTQRVIRKATGFRPCLLRAPYGENPPDVVALARSLRLTTVHWNVDPGDWRGLDADAIAATTLHQVRPGSIAVMHDGENHQQMVQALPRIIDELKRRHYRLLTIPELLRLPVTYRS